MPQFLIDQENINGSDFFLDEGESHHLIDVFRKKCGDEISLFDGKGNSYVGSIGSLAGGKVSGSIISSVKKEMGAEITVFAPLIKGERFEWMLEKVTEIGVSRIQPVITSRTEVKHKAPGKRARWKKLVLSAAKQCMSAVLPEINGPKNFLKAVEDESPDMENIFFWENEKDTSPGKVTGCIKTLSGLKSIGLWIGPEGGFTLDEYTLAKKSGFRICSLGDNKLRAETACIVGLTLAKYLIKDSAGS